MKRCHRPPSPTLPLSIHPPASNSLSTGSKEANPKRERRAQRKPVDHLKARKSRYANSWKQRILVERSQLIDFKDQCVDFPFREYYLE